MKVVIKEVMQVAQKISLTFIGSMLTFAIIGCELPNIAGLNSMPAKTGEMSAKMDVTNEAIHKQTLVLALAEMDKPENQAFTYPIPTGIMAAAKVFAEEARVDELIEFTYLRLRELEEVDPAAGLDKDGFPVAYTTAEANHIRLQKRARLYCLQAIAAFAQDEKVDSIINHDIQGHSRHQATGYSFLALRSSFLRDILLKVSLKLDPELKKENLTTSGMMKEAIKYLVKLDKISKLSLESQIELVIKDEANPDFIKFSEKQDAAGKKATAELWKTALARSVAGVKSYQEQSAKSANPPSPDRLQAEIAAQNSAIETMQTYIDSWKSLVP